VFLAGIRGLIGYILNTLVAFTGFLVAIAAGVGQHYMSEDCPAGEDCSNSAVYIAVCMVRVTKSRSVHLWLWLWLCGCACLPSLALSQYIR
jgi:hypothetical protein